MTLTTSSSARTRIGKDAHPEEVESYTEGGGIVTPSGLVPAVWERGDTVRIHQDRLLVGRAYPFRIDNVPLAMVKRRDGSLDFYYLPEPE